MINQILNKLDFEISDELKIAIETALKAGKSVLNIYNNETDYAVETKGDSSPVTKADLLSDKVILEILEKTQIPILSEESQGEYEHRKNAKKVWVVDPIDGTKDFINKTGEYSVMIGMLEDNYPILGVVYAPSLDKLYFAEKGFGSYVFHNGKITKMSVGSNTSIDSFRLVISRNHFKENEKEFALDLGIKEFIKLGSAGIKFGEIALNNADLYLNLSSSLGEWDLVAGIPILEEAGGKCFDMNGNKLEFNKEIPKITKGAIGTNSNCYEEIFGDKNDK